MSLRHPFKVKEVYPTKPGGREWFMDTNNPTTDGIFDPGSPIKQQPDGSWQINGNLRVGNKYEDQLEWLSELQMAKNSGKM